jgi:GDP-4-dehydro-6-deoxy-D-mannose reductase
LPVDESYRAQPSSFFGASKLAQTEAARIAALEWNLRVFVVRPFNILGPGLPAHYAPAALAQRLLAARIAGPPADFPVVNADATRDFVDVRDVVSAVLQLVSRGIRTAGALEVYNIASGRETTLLALAERLGQLAGGFRPVPAGQERSRSGITRSCGDAGLLRERTGWIPHISWEQSVEDLWSAARDGSAGGVQ